VGESVSVPSVTPQTISSILQPVVTLWKEYMYLYFELYIITIIFGMMRSLFESIRLPGVTA